MAKKTSDDYITASEIGDYLYCQRAWWLRWKGVENSKPEVLSTGTVKHEQLQIQVQNVEREGQLGRRLMLVGFVLLLVVIAFKLLSGMA